MTNHSAAHSTLIGRQGNTRMTPRHNGRVGDRHQRIFSALRGVGIALLLCFALFPLVWILYTSFRNESDILLRSTSLIPDGVTFNNYLKAWNGTDFPKLLLNSLIVSSMTVVIGLSLATFGAYAVSRIRFRGRGTVQVMMLAVRIVPGVLLLIPIYIFLQQLGLIDTTFGLALTYTTFAMPAAFWFMKGFFDGLPADLENAARIDGCSRLGALLRIALPLVKPGLAASAVLIAIESWNDVLFALLLTSTTKSRTWPVGLKLLIGDFQLPWGQLTATAMISIIPVLLGFIFAGRSLVSGLASGGLKD